MPIGKHRGSVPDAPMAFAQKPRQRRQLLGELVSADRSAVSFPSAPRALSACRPPPPNWDDDESPDGLTPLLPSSLALLLIFLFPCICRCARFYRDRLRMQGSCMDSWHCTTSRKSSWDLGTNKGTHGICEIVSHSRMHAVFFFLPLSTHAHCTSPTGCTYCMFMLNADLANPFGSDSKSIWKVLRKTTAVV